MGGFKFTQHHQDIRQRCLVVTSGFFLTLAYVAATARSMFLARSSSRYLPKLSASFFAAAMSCRSAQASGLWMECMNAVYMTRQWEKSRLVSFAMGFSFAGRFGRTLVGRVVRRAPVRHQLHRKPTPTQEARWEAVQQAKSQGLSLRAIARELGMAKNTVGKYLKAESPPTKLLSAKERAKAEALADVQIAAD